MGSVSNSKKLSGGQDHAAGSERSGPEPVGQVPGDGAGNEEAHGQRDHVDAGPQRGLREAVAVLGQPYALEPDDEDEHHPAPAQGGQEVGEVAHREGPDLEQGDPEHGIGHLRLDHREHAEDDHPADQGGEHHRVRPTHGVAAVGLDPVGDPGQHGDQPDGEGDVAPPIDPGRMALAPLLELDVGPDRAETPRAPRPKRPVASPPVRAGRPG